MQRCPFRPGFFALTIFFMWSVMAPVPATASLRCPTTAEMKAEHLFGHWVAQFSTIPPGLPARAILLLERHAEFSDSLAGTVSRELAAAPTGTPPAHAASAALAGDLEDGVLVLDESSDRISITGTWNAEIVEGSCGREFTGLWKDTSRAAPADAPELPFRLTRRP
jgi:hypothetical protein